TGAPGATGPTGATGATGPGQGQGGGGNDQGHNQQLAINQNNVLGSPNSSFLYSGATGPDGPGHSDPHGRALGHIQTQLTTDLTNVGGLVNQFDPTTTPPGLSVAQEHRPAHAGGLGNQDDTPKPDLKNLLGPHH